MLLRKKTKKIIKFLVLVILPLVLLLAFLSKSFFGTSPIDYQGEPETWKGIKPGSTTKEEVIRLLGEPDEIQTTNSGLEELLYPSPESSYKPNFVVLQDNLVRNIVLLSPPDDGSRLKAALAKYGKPDITTYSVTGRGVRNYVFLDGGLMLTAGEINQFYGMSLVAFPNWMIDEFSRLEGKDKVPTSRNNPTKPEVTLRIEIFTPMSQKEFLSSTIGNYLPLEDPFKDCPAGTYPDTCFSGPCCCDLGSICD